MKGENKVERGLRGYDYIFENDQLVHIKNGQVWALACCDCRLVHDIHIHRRKHGRGFKILIQVRRNDKETKALRQAKKARK